MGRRKKTHKEYLEELKAKNIEFAPLEEYGGARIAILHRCSQGHEELICPDYVLRGNSCKECQRLEAYKKYYEDMRRLGITPSGTYVNKTIPIKHMCNKNHSWLAAPAEMLRSKKCPKCCGFSRGFNPGKSAIFYYLKIQNNERTFYKVGITNRKVKDRFLSADINKITILLEKPYEKGVEALEQEQNILREFADYRVHEPGLLVSGGNTELFTEDVLQLDPESSQVLGSHQSSDHQ